MNKHVFILPTDTVFGLGCKMSDKKGLEQIYQLKNRPIEKQIVIVVANLVQLVNILKRELTDTEKLYVNKYWPGAVTFIFDKNDGTKLGVRMPHHLGLLDFVAQNGPIYLTSLNLSGEKEIVDLADIPAHFSKIPVIIRDNPGKQKPSTIFDLETKKILRQGNVEVEKELK
jgi:L-threonylcarbamoyladenylate synthase